MVSDLSQDVDGLSRTWTNAGGLAQGGASSCVPGSVTSLPSVCFAAGHVGGHAVTSDVEQNQEQGKRTRGDDEVPGGEACTDYAGESKHRVHGCHEDEHSCC